MKKKEKHPKNMTTDEAAKHLFHPELIKHVKRETGTKKAK